MAKPLTSSGVYEKLREARLTRDDMGIWFPGNCSACPIAMALIRVFYEAVEDWRFRVLPNQIMLWRKVPGKRWKHFGNYGTTAKARKFIERTDSSCRWRLHYRRQDSNFTFIQ